MAAHKLAYSSHARDDLAALYDWIAGRADAQTASAYVERLLQACRRLTDFPARGTPRPDLGPGARSVSFERKAVIAFSIDEGVVRILRIAHRGRELGAIDDP